MKNEKLVMSLAAETNLKPEEVAAVLAALEATILNECDMGNTVTLKGFGRFESFEMKGRCYKMPDGSSLDKPATNKLKFYSHKDADEFLN